MNWKKIFFVVIGAGLLLVVGVVVLNAVAEKKIATFMATQFPNEKMSFGKVDADVLSGTIEIDSIRYNGPQWKIQIKTFRAQNFHYWDYLIDHKIVLEKVYVGAPSITHFDTQRDSSGVPKKEKNEFKEKIKVLSFRIDNGRYVSIKTGGKTTAMKDTVLYVENISGNISTVYIDQNTLTQKVPFEYSGYAFRADSLYFDMNEYHEVSIGDLSVSDERMRFINLEMRPKYSRAAFRKRIPYEKDLYRLSIDSLQIDQLAFDLNGKNPIFKSPLMKLNGIEFRIYRDKTLPDDLRTKKMYSELLRDLDVKLAIKKTILQNGFIEYEELIHIDRPPGRVAFHDLNATIWNMTNMHLDAENFPKTRLNIHTRFMNTSDLDVQWQFDVSSSQEHFTISGEAKNIPPQAMNPFLVPAMHVRAEGSIDALYFNFWGDQVDATGDMKINYDNFSVTVLKENGEEKNKFLTAIANLFVKANPKDGVVVKQGIEVKRDPTKSFWNYFWSCIEKGLLKSML